MTIYVTFKSFTQYDPYQRKSDQKDQIFEYLVNETHKFVILLCNMHPVIFVGPLNK